MRCSDVDTIIDDHGFRALSAAEKQQLDSHLEECRRCTGAWLTNEALLGERIASPPAGLFAATAQRVREQVAAEPSLRARRRQAVVGIAALFVVVALLALLPRTAPKLDDTPSATAPALEPELSLVEGRDYRRLPAQPLSAASGPVELVQLFAYDCGICYSLEQPLAAWLDTHRGEVALVRMPVQWNPRAARLARAFYAADSLGKADEIGVALFEEIHTRGNALDDDNALAAVFARLGVDRAELERALAAPTTEASASRARALEDAFAITTVPSVVVGGELVTDRVLAETPERMIEIVEKLVECVERERQAAAVPVARHC